MEYLKTFMYDDRLEPKSGPSTLKKTCAERAMMALSDMLEEFPIKDKSKKFNSKTAAREYCLEWMDKQKEWKLIR